MSRNFLDLDSPYCDYDSCRAVVFPCPYEKTTSYLKGTVYGPQRIIEASAQVELFDIETTSEAYKCGIHTLAPFDYSAGTVDTWLDSTEVAICAQLKTGKFPIILGGEHTISIAPIRACSKHFGPSQMSVLHLDAHSDMREEYQGNRYSHASIMKRAHACVQHTYSVGIRAQSIEENEYLTVNKHRFGVLYDQERFAKGLSVEEALRYLPTEKVYITIDLDYFQPEEVPSVGTPVPGGGSWYETIKFLRGIFQKRQVVGFDVVELKPDHDKRSDFFAAQLVYKLITYKFQGT
ncbi:MAG: agmatinase [Deltaproteobacteria bacterium]|nr:agmatinase [Deltaproteobacteria bacterium]